MSPFSPSVSAETYLSGRLRLVLPRFPRNIVRQDVLRAEIRGQIITVPPRPPLRLPDGVRAGRVLLNLAVVDQRVNRHRAGWLTAVQEGRPVLQQQPCRSFNIVSTDPRGYLTVRVQGLARDQETRYPFA